ncbi:MAG TPA: hypothetical protein VK666_09915 [Chryseolinea sp.]|nr:hypothetical protein [Chryseolinea sp.]
MKKILTLALVVASLGGIAQNLTLKWKTEPTLPVPESVLFDAKTKAIYVACIDGKPEEKDGKGSIAKLSEDGKIISAQWATGLDAPKGLGIYKDNLYVADITRIVTISLATGKITSKVEVEGAKFLNDVTVDKKGNVYASDTETGKIHILKGDKAEVYFESPEFKGVNGLLALDNEMYVLDFATGTNYKLSADKKLTVFGKTSEGADGVVPVGKDEYLVSNWNGEVYYISAKGQAKKLIDTKAEKVSAADIEYDSKTKTLFVPTFFANSVVAYTFSK